MDSKGATMKTYIEKCAKLMGKEFYEKFLNLAPAVENWNPLANKEDLSDVIDELSIDICWETYDDHGDLTKTVAAYTFVLGVGILHSGNIFIDNHPNKFTARAHAVMAVVEKIYDARFGKDGE